MPKRDNPFGDHSSLQLKLHLRGIETENGVHQQRKQQSVYACHRCRLSVPYQDVRKCQFCENYVCCDCVRQCKGCHLHFCLLCSVTNSNQAAERAFCQNCQRK